MIILSNELDAQEWKNLFNGKNLQGWTVLNGTAEYSIEDGAIVGTTKPGTPNTFLATDEHYDDFILEAEVWVDPSVNSGIQFRSNSLADYQDHRVHGYQFELDPSERKWTGGIYDEARRGWLYPLTENPKAQNAFQNGTWNKIRIEAIGQHLNTWVNGIHCSRLVDDMTDKGFIALQVHSIQDESQANKQIKWKNIRIITSMPEKHRSVVSAPMKNVMTTK